MPSPNATPTPITPPRVPIIDPRTGLIDRAWYLFFLSLFQSVTNVDTFDVGPANSATVEQISELSKLVDALNKALQLTVLAPTNEGVIEQINEFVKVLASTLIAPNNASVTEQISELSKQLKALQIEPANAGVLEQISELAKVVAKITVISLPALVGPENTAVADQVGELAKQLKAFQIEPTNSALLEQIATLQNEIKSFYLLPPNQQSAVSGGGVTSVDGSGGTTGLTLLGGPITSTGTLTIGGILNVANGGTGAATLDTAGIVTKSGSQVITGQKSFTSPTSQFLGLTYATSDGGSGSNAYFGENLAYATIGGVNGVVLASGATFPGTGRYVGDSVSWRPFVDATYSCGTGAQRWSSVNTVNLAVSGTVTSGTWNGSTIAVAYGGTGTTTPSLVAGTNVTITGSWPNQTINSSGGGSGMVYPGAGIANSTGSAWGTSYSTTGSGNVVLSTSPTLVTPILGTPQSGNFSTGTFTWPTFNQNTTGTAANVSGIVAIANGGTGASSFATAGLPTLSGSNTFTGQNNFNGASNYFRALAFTTSDGASGNNAYFGESAAYAAIGGVNGVVLSSGATFPGTSRYVGDSASWRPYVTNTYSCGTSSLRWSNVYTVDLAVSGTVTSGTWNGTAIGTAYGGTGSTSTTFVDLATNVTGTLPVANGGTGASSLTGAGIVTTTNAQTISGAKSFTSYTSQFLGITYATTDGVSASNAYLGESSAYAVVGGANGVIISSGATYPGTGRYVGDTVSWRPFADATYSLGTGAQRWTAVYAVNGTIQTSDRTEKQQIAELNAAELAVAKRIKGLIRKFKFNDAVVKKGDNARIHVGVIAQDVEAAFTAEGLDASKYGLFCSDTWITLDGQPQTRLGVRYEELLAFVIGSL